MDNPRLYDLFNRYTNGQLTTSEELELAAMVIDPANEKDIAELEADYWEQLKNVIDPLARSAEQSLQTILPGKVVPMRRKLVRVAAAASILLLIGLGTYFAFFNKSKQPGIVQTQEQRFKNDVNPGGYKAKLTLADGREIVLDSVVAGELATQGGTVVMNKDGQLVYQDGGRNAEVMYNTLSTAKGEIYATTLSDGSKIWLNSASSIKFPVAFVGDERKVEITGEAYFEVAKDASKKFIVSSNGVTTEVLGTHFNVNTYTDESSINVTLLEGSVKVSKNSKDVIIKPGQQAQVSDDVKVASNVDIEQVMAWKNGIFQFENADVASVMRQLSRWYNVEIVYEKPISKKVSLLNVPRTMTIINILKIMEMTGNVKFEIEGNKVKVIP